MLGTLSLLPHHAIINIAFYGLGAEVVVGRNFSCQHQLTLAIYMQVFCLPQASYLSLRPLCSQTWCPLTKGQKQKSKHMSLVRYPSGRPGCNIHIGFYIFALLFVAFDVDIVFIISWAVIFKQLSLFGFFEMLFFIIVLALGLVYAWRKGVTRWI